MLASFEIIICSWYSNALVAMFCDRCAASGYFQCIQIFVQSFTFKNGANLLCAGSAKTVQVMDAFVLAHEEWQAADGPLLLGQRWGFGLLENYEFSRCLEHGEGEILDLCLRGQLAGQWDQSASSSLELLEEKLLVMSSDQEQPNDNTSLGCISHANAPWQVESMERGHTASWTKL